ncbi:hypothetical protein GUJ93_ZPchr0007g3817 [Zizania palustris]|uniref:Cytochrome b5 heme-binding domain-containing protein n=1 Tax=Zizania palustris TaxID=103762 RepID=A0A8J5SV33_ZIZPA|nr:hypothetical protein GUJ93_ZPchr0007g3817 [Zizania palustris]
MVSYRGVGVIERCRRESGGTRSRQGGGQEKHPRMDGLDALSLKWPWPKGIRAGANRQGHAGSDADDQPKEGGTELNQQERRMGAHTTVGYERKVMNQILEGDERVVESQTTEGGLKGQSNRRLISLEEVKQHKTGECIWTVLKGRVYNIAPYMKFHPGGVDMLMKAAGKDSTAMFSILLFIIYYYFLHLLLNVLATLQ